MILHGKAKELFEKWYLENNKHYDKLTVLNGGKLNQFYRLPKTMQNAIIIEWLDSVGITIVVRPKNLNSWDYEVHDLNNLDYVFGCEYLTRQEATTEAIKVAVGLINKEL